MTDEPTISSLLEKQITALERSLNQRLDTTEKNVSERFDRQDRELREIKEQTLKTNGRVTVLERARERGLGMVTAFRWIPAVIAAGLSSGLTLLGMALAGAFH